ncbi:MAG: hypothetical protein HHJ09_13980 [Glaciimonas sp.]|nr:hypothetical protein [Glaciimonas sp.]
MANAKTATLTVRIDPAIKEVLRAFADQEHRSIANMIEMMIRGYCGRGEVTTLKQDVLFDNIRKPTL